MPLVNFQQYNPTEQHKKPNVVLIHGLFGSLENLNMVAKGLTDNAHVISMDVRNHGSSFHENNMNYDALAKDVIDLLDHLHIEKAHLLGHSMGGKVAMQVALLYPERVDKLIVADIAPVDYPPHHTQIIEGLKSIDLSKVSKRSDADTQLAPFVDNLGIRQFLLRNLTAENGQFTFKCNLEFIEQCYPQIMQGYQGNNLFDGPTLFIKGGDSDYIQMAHKTKINKILPHSSVKIIQGAGHWLHAEKTVAFNKIVNDFLIS